MSDNLTYGSSERKDIHSGCEEQPNSESTAAKVGRTRRWNSLRSEIIFQGFGWWLLRLLRGQRTYGWKLWKP